MKTFILFFCHDDIRPIHQSLNFKLQLMKIISFILTLIRYTSLLYNIKCVVMFRVHDIWAQWNDPEQTFPE